jgi:nucleoside 2-deoxyribosyltransferase
VREKLKDAATQQHAIRTRQKSATRTYRNAVPKQHADQLKLEDLVHWGWPPDDYGRRRLLTVYLGGPIAGKAYAGASDWRQRVARQLAETAPHIRLLDPMRGKHELKGVEKIEAGNGGVLYGSKITVGRDLWDVAQCDAVLVNLSEATEVSIGSMIELGHARAQGKFVVVVLPDERKPNPHDHPFVTQVATAVVRDIAEGIRILEEI